MKLKDILSRTTVVDSKGNLDIEITGVENDSRKIKPGHLFVAVKGFESDGHRFCKQAISNGAKALIVEEPVVLDEEVSVVVVDDSRKSLGFIAECFYDYPAEKMDMVGITGTNGKTSTALLTYHIMEDNGHRTGVIGTISNRIHDLEIEAERTTPEGHDLQKLFRQMVDAKVDTAVMEVSSHALALHRVDGINFKAAAFTNLSLDHLDFHQTMENYLEAKSKLFQMAEVGIVNADDSAITGLLKNHSCQKVLTYSLKDRSADFYAKEIVHRISGTEYILCYNGKEYPVSLKTPGNFSVYNSLAAIGITSQLGIAIEDISASLAKHSQVRGRFESVVLSGGFTAVVDYAHTPDGLENILKSIQEFKSARVLTVFGCGGDRDRTKRPLMAKVAERYSDIVVVTSDNPRTENPDAIIAEIVTGLTKKDYIVEADRKKAIEKALEIAEENDIILIAGKGHEDYQIIGKEKIHFDDMEIVKEWECSRC